MLQNRIPVILDTDPGVDDTLALLILFRSPKVDLRLVTSVAGNVSIERTTANALYLTKSWAGDIPVAKGFSSPLGVDASYVHGESGLGHFRIPAHVFYLDPRNAVEAMKDTLLSCEEKVTLVTLGPVTNVARLIRDYPETLGKISRVYAMIASKDGTGNITPYAEFNAYCDPAALKTLVDSGLEVVFAPMHLGRDGKIATSLLLSCAEKTDKYDMMKDLFDGYCDSAAGKEYVAMYDANASEALLHPELYDFVRCDATVNTTDKPGQTFLTPNETGRFYRIEIRNTEEFTETVLKDLFG